MNGRYAPDGFHGGKAKFKQVEGDSIIFFDGRWKMTDEDDTGGWIYESRQSNSPLPPSEWEIAVPGYGAAPSLSLGTCRDLQEGDEVTTVQDDSEADWSGFPAELSTFHFSPSQNLKVGSVHGDWFSPGGWFPLCAPLSALGYVSFHGKKHRITELSASSSPQQAGGKDEVVEVEIVGGYDEDWCDDQDVEKYRCAICYQVARNAMAHECGSSLFCEGCWRQCMDKDSKCPLCRQDGSRTAPAYADRRRIHNLLVKCNCGARMNLCDKVGLKKSPL